MSPPRPLDRRHGSSSRSLNALAAEFDPKSFTPTVPSSMHRAKSFSFDAARSTPSSASPRGRGFKRRTPSGYFPGTNSARQASLQGGSSSNLATTGAFDPFVTTTSPLSAAAAVAPVQANPYSQDTAAALGGTAFFAGQSGFQQPVSA